MNPALYPLCACFTGHRRLPKQTIDALVASLTDAIRTLYFEHTVHHFLSGGAVGFDLLAASTLLQLQQELPDLHLHLILPCQAHTKNWSAQDKLLFETVTEKAESVLYTAPLYREDCMLIRDRYLIDHSKFCIAYFTKKTSGTGYTVRYAKERGIPVWNLAKEEADKSTREHATKKAT